MKNKTNFFVATKATFVGCRRPSRRPDYVSLDREGNVSSEYWYTSDGVYRCSNHWSKMYSAFANVLTTTICGKVASCYWRLRTTKNTRCGFALWSAFQDMK